MMQASEEASKRVSEIAVIRRCAEASRLCGIQLRISLSWPLPPPPPPPPTLR
jgi:hypothetical protein